jgi:hypothetical protein
MASDVFQLRTAKSRVSEYEHEFDDLAVRCAEANECRDLEDFLRLGIEAFDWIERADLWLRGVVASESISRDEEDAVVAAIDAMCRAWLRPCKFARDWIARVQAMDFQIENLDRFRECCLQMESIVADQGIDTKAMTSVLADMKSAALEDHRNGETAEFV